LVRAVCRKPTRCCGMVERGHVFRELLQHALTVTVALVGQRQDEELRTLTVASLAQNEEVKRISAWAAILFAPHPDWHHPRHELPTPCPSCTGRWGTRWRCS